MATSRKQSTDDQDQDATHNQAQNHAQTPDQQAANSGAFAQSSYQSTQQAGTHRPAPGSQSQSHGGRDETSRDPGNTNKMLDTAIEAGKKWIQDSGMLRNAGQLPEAAKEWGTKALGRVSGLSTTQKVFGGAMLLAGVAYLSSRGKNKSSYSSDDEDEDYRSARRSGSDYKQGAWAGYAGGKSAARRSTEAGSRADVSSYGAERRASGGSSYGRSTGTGSGQDMDFGSGRESSGSGRATDQNRSQSDSGIHGSGGSYDSGRDASAPAGTSTRAARIPNSNEQDYDA